jgi:hypothetical protein
MQRVHIIIYPPHQLPLIFLIIYKFYEKLHK